MSVIYAIKNLINNKVYIGSSKSPKKRKYKHFYDLKKGQHHSPHLQRSYDNYGKDMFSFYIIEECSEDDRLQREVFHIESYQSHLREYGYNIYEPDGKKFCCSDQTKQKILDKNSWKISVDLYNVEGEFLGTFPSIKRAACSVGLEDNHRVFHRMIKGTTKSCRGYVIVKEGEPFTYVKSPKTRDMVKFRK